MNYKTVLQCFSVGILASIGCNNSPNTSIPPEHKKPMTDLTKEANIAPMTLSIIDSFAPVDDSAIMRFESETGYKLPTEYQRLLKEHNGGVFRPSMIFDKAEISIDIFVLYALDVDEFDRSEGLRWRRDVLSDRLPEDLLAFAETGSGDQFCICISERRFGQVYLWEHEAAAGEKDLRFLAESLSDFLSALEPRRFTPLEQIPEFRAVERGDTLEFPNLLGDNGNVDIRNERGRTLLMCALSNHHIDAVKWLIENGADVTATDDKGRQPIHMAVVSHWRDGVRLMLNNGADIDAVDHERETPLNTAIKRSSFRIARLLIERGADLEVLDNNGNTALLAAVQNRDLEITKLLIESGADLKAQATDGKSALGHISNPKLDFQLRQLLIDHGVSE
jgi:ankyrin repeat protein